MLKLRHFVLALVTAALLLPVLAQAQDLHPSRRKSPVGIAQTFVGDAYVKITYGRPYKRDRDNIFGTGDDALVPFGKVWRTGANEATEITLTGDLKVEGQLLKAGTYTLFTTPGPDSWKVHFNSDLGLWGTLRRNAETKQWENGYNPEHDVLVVEVKPTTLEDEVDQLTFRFVDVEGGAQLQLRWIHTQVSILVAPAN